MKTALITGVSYGIGASITHALLEREWKVYGISRSKPGFTNKAFFWLECDLRNSKQIKNCLEKITEVMLDCFVSNAGFIEIEMASAVTEQSFDRTFSVNLLAPMIIIHELHEKISNATIITLSSVSDRIPEADVALYCSSKAANTSYFNALAQELTNAHVYSILPDYVDTPMLHSTMDSDKTFDWDSAINSKDIARLLMDIIEERQQIETGSNIIVVNEALKNDLKSVEKLYGYNTDTNHLSKI